MKEIKFSNKAPVLFPTKVTASKGPGEIPAEWLEWEYTCQTGYLILDIEHIKTNEAVKTWIRNRINLDNACYAQVWINVSGGRPIAPADVDMGDTTSESSVHLWYNAGILTATGGRLSVAVYDSSSLDPDEIITSENAEQYSSNLELGGCTVSDNIRVAVPIGILTALEQALDADISLGEEEISKDELEALLPNKLYVSLCGYACPPDDSDNYEDQFELIETREFSLDNLTIRPVDEVQIENTNIVYSLTPQVDLNDDEIWFLLSHGIKPIEYDSALTSTEYVQNTYGSSIFSVGEDDSIIIAHNICGMGMTYKPNDGTQQSLAIRLPFVLTCTGFDAYAIRPAIQVGLSVKLTTVVDSSAPIKKDGSSGEDQTTIKEWLIYSNSNEVTIDDNDYYNKLGDPVGVSSVTSYTKLSHTGMTTHMFVDVECVQGRDLDDNSEQQQKGRKVDDSPSVVHYLPIWDFMGEMTSGQTVEEYLHINVIIPGQKVIRKKYKLDIDRIWSSDEEVFSYVIPEDPNPAQ